MSTLYSYPGQPPPGFDTEAAITRHRNAIQAAIEVFGDDDYQGAWAHQYNDQFGKSRVGGPQTPAGAAYDSEEGLQQVLAALVELAKTTTPKWKPKIKGQRVRSWKPRR
ncbi:MAG: hypothetical protein ACT4QA_11380 [Panacagrimonas sp.]